jgi:transcriptional regulator with XRE-family HTH domain
MGNRTKEGNWPAFAKAFKEFYNGKNFTSAYQLAQSSNLENYYLTKMKNNPILNPSEETIEKLAQAFAERNNTKLADEKKDIREFFKEWKEKQSSKSPSSSEIQAWEVKLIQVETNDLSYFKENMLPQIMATLENVGEGMILVKYVKKSSIILGLESSDESYERIRNCHQRGELSELLGVTVADLQLKPSLTQWFDNIFSTGWQTVEELLTPQQLRPAYFTESIQRAKRIDLQIDLITHTVNLVMSLTRENADNVIVNLKVFPTYENPNLPPNLKLILLTEGEVFKEVTSRSADQYIQYEFEAEPGDEFAVKLALGDAEITEDFVV